MAQQAQPDKLPVVHKFTSQVFGDYKQDPLDHAPAARHHLRGVLLVAVCALVAVFTALKYSTDDGLRSSIVTVRHNDVKNVANNTVQLESSRCLCSNSTLLWSSFLSYDAAFTMGNTGTQCIDYIIPGHVSGSAVDVNKFGPSIALCSILVDQVKNALNSNLNNINTGDNYQGSQLLSSRQLEARVAGWVGGLHVAATHAVNVMQLFQSLHNINLNITVAALVEAGQLTQAQADTLRTSIEVDSIVNDQTQQVLANSTSYTAPNPSKLAFTELNFDYIAYVAACAAPYCDVPQSKSVVARISEFIGLVGGLWATFIGLAVATWALVGKFSWLQGPASMQPPCTVPGMPIGPADEAVNFAMDKP